MFSQKHSFIPRGGCEKVVKHRYSPFRASFSKYNRNNRPEGSSLALTVEQPRIEEIRLFRPVHSFPFLRRITIIIIYDVSYTSIFHYWFFVFAKVRVRKTTYNRVTHSTTNVYMILLFAFKSLITGLRTSNRQALCNLKTSQGGRSKRGGHTPCAQ